MKEWTEKIKERGRAVIEITSLLNRQMSLEDAGKSFVDSVLRHLPWLIDFGLVAEAYEICEILETRWRKASRVQARPANAASEVQETFRLGSLTCGIYVRHMDLARRRKIIEHRRFFEELLLSAGDAFFVAHAHSGMGLIAVYEGRQDEGAAHFQEARDLFHSIDRPVDALKMRVRLLMLLRMERRYLEADREASDILAEALKRGVDAISPVLICHATLGSNCLETGRRFEAQRHLREAAKLAQVMPPSSASAFALFHYGHVLETLGRRKEALAWLKRAEKIQRTADPIARCGTLIVMLRCERLEENWNAARELASAVLGDQTCKLDGDDARELFDEAMKVYEALFDDSGMSQAVERAFDWSARFIADESERESYRAGLVARARTFTHSMALATILPPPGPESEAARSAASAGSAAAVASFERSPESKRIHIAPSDGVLCVASRNGAVHRIAFSRDSAMGRVVECLLAARVIGQRDVQRERLLSSLAVGMDAKKSDSVRRKFDRVVNVLTELGALQGKETRLGDAVGFDCEACLFLHMRNERGEERNENEERAEAEDMAMGGAALRGRAVVLDGDIDGARALGQS